MRDGSFPNLDVDVDESAIVIFVRDFEGFHNLVICMLLGRHVWWLDVLQDCCVVLGNGLVGHVLFQQTFYHLWVKAQ